MKFDRTGIILYTLKYKECIHFYQNVIGLIKIFETETLTCFNFGYAYLMIEIDNEQYNIQAENYRIRTCLRMNVPNVNVLVEKLEKNNISVDYQEYSWGTIAKFFDPDGNLCAFKDSEKFEQQINQNQTK
jgi:lactoylglutathione lyase